jgi:hypothetical protein
LLDVRFPRRSGERRGRANSRADAQENLFHPDTDPAPQKENCHCGEKEITDANPIANAAGCRFAEKEKVSCARGNAIAHNLAKKKEGFANTGGIAITVAKS